MSIRISQQAIRDSAASAETYRRGVSYLKDGMVRSVNFSPLAGGGFACSAIVQGSTRLPYQCSATFSIGSNVSVRCTCPATGHYRGLCKHSIAMLLVAYCALEENFNRQLSMRAAAKAAPAALPPPKEKPEQSQLFAMPFLPIGNALSSSLPPFELGAYYHPITNTERTLMACASKVLHWTDGADGADEAQQPFSNTMNLLMRQYEQAQQVGQSIDCSLLGSVHLTPAFTDKYYETSCAMSFKVGVTRAFVLRDVHAFLNALQKGADVTYGKTFHFVHKREMFDEQSQRLIDWMERRYYEGLYETPRPSYSTFERPACMQVSNKAFDEFFEMYLGETFEFQEFGSLTFCQGSRKPQVHASLTKSGDLLLECNLMLLRDTGKHLYVYDWHKCRKEVVTDLFQCDAAMSKAIGPFLHAVSNADYSLTLSGPDIPTFCATVLPLLLPHISLEDSSSCLHTFLPEEMALSIYLDAPAREQIDCFAAARYGDDEFNLLDGGFRTLAHTGVINAEDAKRAKAHLRDTLGESAAVTALSAVLGTPGEHSYTVAGIDAICDLLSSGLEQLHALGVVQISERLQRLTIAPPLHMTVGVSLDSGLLRMSFDTGGLNPEELADALQAYREKRKYHRLKDGAYLRLNDPSLEELAQLADGLELSNKQLAQGTASMPAFRAMYLDGLFRDDRRMGFKRDSAFKQLVRAVKAAADSDYALPAGFRGELRAYQESGYRWLRTLSDCSLCGILADDMGLGKTIELIALLQSDLESDAEKQPSLIVCPASMVLNWRNELERFAPEIPTRVVIGTADARNKLIAGIEPGEVVLTSYDLLKRDVERYENHAFRYFVLDEAQFIKNQSTKGAQAVKRINGEHRFALTGTPIENRLSELWSIFDFLMPGYLFSYAHFRAQYEQPIVRDASDDARTRLQRMISPFILRRLKRDVLSELPPKVTTITPVALKGEQQTLYAAYAQNVLESLRSLSDRDGQGKIQIFAMLMRLRQICCDPSLCYENYGGDSAKLEVCLELLEQARDGGHRVLLFSQFTTMLDLIAARLTQAGISFYMLTGATKKETRMELVNRFNSDDTIVFLISLKAGGTGLNLTGADTVIHYDPWWNLAAQDQATDRAYRIGQKRSVQVYKLIAKQTIEERMLALQNMKGDLASVIEGGETSLASMSKEELISLFTEGRN
ncbi:MAG: DEAD/DEAH box helicase [Clostridia bacterium]